jgi:HSP20 family protein
MCAKRRIVRAEWLEGNPEAWRLLREGWVVFRHARAWEPPTDVYENEVGLVVQVEIAGMEEEDFSVAVGERALIIEGTRRDPEPKRAYHQMEIRYGEFRAEVYLPWSVAPDAIEAVYEAGFLRVLLPRPPRCRVSVVGGQSGEE